MNGTHVAARGLTAGCVGPLGRAEAMRRSTVLCVLWALVGAGQAWAQGGTISDQSVSLVYGNQHWSAIAPLNLLGVDAADPLLQSGWWYRIEGGDETREHPFPAPDVVQYDGGRMQARWDSLNNFTFWEETYVFDNEGPSGGFLSLIFARNNNLSPREVTLFHYAHLALGSPTLADLGLVKTNRFIQFYDGLAGTSRASYKAWMPADAPATQFTVRHAGSVHPQLWNQLLDNEVTTFTNDGPLYGPGELDAAYEFGPVVVPSAATLQLAAVALYVNPASDHVRGDAFGLYNSTPLIWERSTFFNERGQLPMRRTTGVPGLGTGLPDDVDPYPTMVNAKAMGIDDFDGDFVDELLTRDPYSGELFMGGGLVLAPTYGLDWKTSSTGDFDHDGKADILWRNTLTQRLVIWKMSGSTRTDLITPSPNHAVDANWEVAGSADFNGDGNRDILWYNQTTGKIVLWYMDENVARITGAFTTPSSVGDNNWRVVAVGDFGKGAGGLSDTQDVVWQNDTSEKIVVWHMDKNGARTSGLFTTPDSLGPGVKVVGPR